MSTQAPLPTPVHNSAAKRFEIHVDGHVGVIDYRGDGDQLVLPHVGVPPALEGRGIAGSLTRAALDWARDSGMRVVPVCPYVVAWLKRHPEYADLIAAD